MEIIIKQDQNECSIIAARLVAALIRKKPNAVLGLATGSSPVGLYKELIRMHREEGLDFSQVRSFNLDEYVGLSPEHRSSYHAFMQREFFSQVNIDPSNVHIPDGLVEDVPAYCLEYEASIKAAGGIDMQLLGIGSDGHIGFNEPSSSLASRTRIKTLTERTRADNAPFFKSPEDVPYHVITMGIGTILESKCCLLLAFGAKKASAIAAAAEGPLTAMVPASALQLHPSVKCFVDIAAASRLQRLEYYNYVFAHKPTWQRD